MSTTTTTDPYPVEEREADDAHPHWSSKKGRAQLRQEVRRLMTEVRLADLLPSELFGLINILGEARLRIDAESLR
jgi:hypothetical protein